MFVSTLYTDELTGANSGDSQPVNKMESRMKALGVGLPIPTGNIELKNTKDAGARRSINFVPSAPKSVRCFDCASPCFF